MDRTTTKPRTRSPILLPDEVLFGRTEAMSEIRQRARKVCQMTVSILLTGAGGTGKEALARWIHEHSAQREGQFVKVNCAAIPGSLLESELFGFEKGAFTGAQNAKPGRVEFAHNGTLFLDEIADLDSGLQSKLLHFLQDGSFTRIGDHSERTVNARVICATHCDLPGEIAAGRFRADLFYRINVVHFKLPALRERREDIPALAEHFRGQFEEQFEKDSEPIRPEVLDYWQNLEWPGNIREFSNTIARYVLVGPDAAPERPIPRPRIAVMTGPSAGSEIVPLKRVARDAIREMEKNVILETLRENRWNRRRTAQALKISYRALIYKIRNAGLVSTRTRRISSASAEVPFAQAD